MKAAWPTGMPRTDTLLGRRGADPRRRPQRADAGALLTRHPFLMTRKYAKKSFVTSDRREQVSLFASLDLVHMMRRRTIALHRKSACDTSAPPLKSIELLQKKARTQKNNSLPQRLCIRGGGRRPTSRGVPEVLLLAGGEFVRQCRPRRRSEPSRPQHHLCVGCRAHRWRGLGACWVGQPCEGCADSLRARSQDEVISWTDECEKPHRCVKTRLENPL